MVGRADMLEMDREVMAANHKAANIDLSKMLQPAADLRPGAAQINVTKQDHGLETGLDVHLVPLCKAALPDVAGQDAEPVYVAIGVQNTPRGAGVGGGMLADVAVVGAERVPVVQKGREAVWNNVR